MITTRKLERQRRKYKITPPRKGDVFTIPLDDGRVHLGQVIAFERFDLECSVFLGPWFLVVSGCVFAASQLVFDLVGGAVAER